MIAVKFLPEIATQLTNPGATRRDDAGRPGRISGSGIAGIDGRRLIQHIFVTGPKRMQTIGCFAQHDRRCSTVYKISETISRRKKSGTRLQRHRSPWLARCVTFSGVVILAICSRKTAQPAFSIIYGTRGMGTIRLLRFLTIRTIVATKSQRLPYKN